MVLADVVLLVVGFGLLALGGEGLVRGAVRIATRFGVAPMVVGLTVVSFGTSAPELLVSVVASFDGRGAFAFGNVVGSNVFNVLAVLGPVALVAPVAVRSSVIRREVPLYMAVALLLVVAALDARITRVEGAAFVVGLVAYTGFAWLAAKREAPEVAREYEAIVEPPREGPSRPLLLTIGGLALLALGAEVVVRSAISLATAAGVPERVVALTLVAIGTSLPELTASVVAAVRGQSDIAVGNVVGSSIFNVLGILGVAALVRPLVLDADALPFDLGAVVAVALVLVPLVRTGRVVSRVEGAALLLAYVGYVAWLLLAR